MRNPWRHQAPVAARISSLASKKDRESAAADHANRERSLGHSGVQWTDVQYGTGKLKIGVEYVENRAGKLQIEDFELLKLVGKGSFGKVMQVRKKDTHRIYAVKTIRKAHIISRSEVAHTLAERSVLAQINNPFIVPLKFTFQSPAKLYFVLAFINGGELFHHLQKEQRFDVNRSRFYTAELLCALECLHGFNVIYRDLKPENILLDYQGHIALCDFGLCKLDMKDEDRTNTFCGTPEYLAPELLMGQGYQKTVDWWTLGVLLYEMLTGLPPFYDENTNEMYRKILSEPLHFPGHDIVPPAAKDLLIKLLNRKPEERLGANGSAEIKAHPFFHAIDWRKLLQRKYEPAFKPSVTMQNQFQGFSYNRPIAGLGDAGGSIKDPRGAAPQLLPPENGGAWRAAGHEQQSRAEEDMHMRERDLPRVLKLPTSPDEQAHFDPHQHVHMTPTVQGPFATCPARQRCRSEVPKRTTQFAGRDAEWIGLGQKRAGRGPICHSQGSSVHNDCPLPTY
ncbi:serine/threonine-protein kinase gad8 [Verticillium alfalfae VaMs.102]|uniref:non-specific serine/threonine protein kinase n=1 Tax=Verticillium alfalfae (strain VaMs.102 / ATCC MYA-4576 / FGSC 10136) TaxID=526221 RepID=C9S5K2_VERA1|nr:serine/threonine-protein kinase gad8 [Verticillium alfalfae VaMs.102]EEY15066.1 serine/threonine-protein kinase gad8 [Verticillium alfalfae VaMs.102]